MTQYFDVTELVGLSANSGIQRVVREIVLRRRALASSRGDGPIVPVMAVGAAFHALSPEGEAALRGERAAVPGADRGGRTSLAKRALRSVPALFTFAQSAKFARSLKGPGRTFYQPDPVTFSADDRVVLIDSFWNGSRALDAATAARKQGAAIVLVVYDLIPIAHPEIVASYLAYAFRQAIGRAVKVADAAVAISQQSRDEFTAYAGARLDRRRIGYFYLGHDFGEQGGEAPDAAAVLPDAPWGGKSATFLMLGTIEPRKGHHVAIEAFERLWADGGEQTLVIIGKVGWKTDALMHRLRTSPQLGRKLFLVHDASDAQVADALRRADATIMASSLEGFGLPVVEALSAGTPVIASDIPVFREIAEGSATFFTCGDPTSLAQAIVSFETDIPDARSRAAAFRWIYWDEATVQFDAAVAAVLANAEV